MAPSVSAGTIAAALWRWLLTRGILYGLISAPMLALMIGYFYRWTTTPIASLFTVTLAFAVIPIWVLLRKRMSDDPSEPVHHLHVYALWALVPYVVYNLARIPMHFLLGIVFWDHWYDFGAELTGEPVDQWSSLIPGTFIHSLQGYVLALGFFILFKRHSLLNALIYVFLGLSVVYTWSFPTYVLVDFQPPPKWFFVVWWAHFWMAIATWFMATHAAPLWRRLTGRLAKAIAIGILALLYFVPVGFVFFRVATWQFDYQRQIDEATFDQVQVVLGEGPVITQAPTAATQASRTADTHYRFALRFGPRPYVDYIAATKALDAGPVHVVGRLLSEEAAIAHCWAFVPQLETPNTIVNPAEYFPALERMVYTDIRVECVGTEDPHSSGLIGQEVQVEWRAQLTLIGDRETTERVIESRDVAVLEEASAEP